MKENKLKARSPGEIIEGEVIELKRIELPPIEREEELKVVNFNTPKGARNQGNDPPRRDHEAIRAQGKRRRINATGWRQPSSSDKQQHLSIERELSHE